MSYKYSLILMLAYSSSRGSGQISNGASRRWIRSSKRIPILDLAQELAQVKVSRRFEVYRAAKAPPSYSCLPCGAVKKPVLRCQHELGSS